MVIPSSSRMWWGSAIFVSLLVAGCYTASASSQTATTTATSSSMKSVLAASIVPSGTYTEIVRKQMNWVASPVIDNVKAENDSDLEKTEPTPSPISSPSVTIAAQKTESAAQTAQSDITPVQISASSQQQVSRSDSLDLVNNALSLVGAPYAFGGTSRSGFDCSGYTQYVFKGSGSYLPRTASGQFRVGSSVTQAQLQSGDLVFFSTYASGASHVGIYIGGGNFVHASNCGVCITSLSDSYFAGRYLGARRVR